MSVSNTAKLVFGNPQHNGHIAQFERETNEVAKIIIALAELTDDEYLPF